MGLSRDTVTGIALSHVETLECYAAVTGDSVAAGTLATAVEALLTNQPWYYRSPMDVVAFCLGAVCVLVTGKRLTRVPVADRQQFVGWLRRIPLFSLIDTFAQSVAFLTLFDDDRFVSAMPYHDRAGTAATHV